jgi:hypothetical protein
MGNNEISFRPQRGKALIVEKESLEECVIMKSVLSPNGAG